MQKYLHLNHVYSAIVVRASLLAGKMPAIAALAYHRASGRNISQPNQRLSYSENFLYMLDAANKPG